MLIGISEQNLDRLLRVQPKAARIVCNAGLQVTSSDVLYSLHWLPVHRRTEFKTATLCFKAVKLDLKHRSVLHCRSSCGNPFQIRGSATEKRRRPKCEELFAGP